jgi:hypothetical protein
MRSRHILGWSTGILLSAVLAGCVCLFFSFPWKRCQEKLKESLRARLGLSVDFERLEVFFRGGPGISIEPFRVSPAGKHAGKDTFLAADRLTFIPSLKGLARGQIDARIFLEAPALHLSRQAAGDAPSAAAVLGAFTRGTGSRPPGGSLAPDRGPSPRPKSLSDLIPLPGGFTLTGVSLAVQQGSLTVAPLSDEEPEPAPPLGILGVRGSLRVEQDLSFRLDLADGSLQWNQPAAGPALVAGMLSAEISGRALSLDEARIAATIRLADGMIKWRERAVALTEPIQISCNVEGKAEEALLVSQILLTGPGMEIGMSGSTRLSDTLSAIDIRDLRVKVEDWQPFCSLLRPGTAFSGRLSLAAERLGLDPARLALPAFRFDSFRPEPPAGLTTEGLEVHLSEGRLSQTDLRGCTASLEGLAILLEQKDREWTATIESARLETIGQTSGGEAFRFSGPFSAKARWSEEEAASVAILAADLTGARIVCPNLLDKPQNVPLDVGVRARVMRDEIRLAAAFLHLGETELTLKGAVRDRSDPLLDARLATNVLSLDSLAPMLPAVRGDSLGGRMEIKELAVSGRLRRMRESLLIKARVASKDLRLHGTAVKGLYAQAVFGQRKLTVSPALIQPASGMIEAMFTADFSQPSRQGDAHPYYGTLKIDHVDIDELARLTRPALAGHAGGTADVNLAFRGSGFDWPGAANNLEAKARICLKDLVLTETEEEHSSESSKESLAGRFLRMLEVLDPHEAGPQPNPPGKSEGEPRLGTNRAAGWFTMRDGITSTDNLVAVYEGKLVEIRGSVDLSGRLHVETGRLFVGGRMIPFQIDCMPGKESCTPRPDLQEMGKSAAAELGSAVRTLSEATAGVFKDLLF